MYHIFGTNAQQIQHPWEIWFLVLLLANIRLISLKPLAWCCRPKRLLLSCVLCYLFLWMGYLGIAVSRHIVPMCLSIMWKSFGSAVIWMYSTLLLQLRVPDNLLGRMLALEMAIFTVSLCSSVVSDAGRWRSRDSRSTPMHIPQLT